MKAMQQKKDNRRMKWQLGFHSQDGAAGMIIQAQQCQARISAEGRGIFPLLLLVVLSLPEQKFGSFVVVRMHLLAVISVALLVVQCCGIDQDLESFRNVSRGHSMRRRGRSHSTQGGENFFRSASSSVIGGDGLFKFVVVDQSALTAQTGIFKTIQAAIDAVPAGNQHWIFIQVGPGVYHEKIMIPYSKSYIVLQGAGRDFTTISWSDTASTLGTANSATFSAFAPNFIAKYISFRNNAPPPPPGALNRQAVAALIAGDMAAFYSCGFYGAQDTLFDYQGRHYYRDCYIEGSIDFIFGHAKSVFKGCELHAIAESVGSVTAHNRGDPRENSGFIFISCTITGTGTIFLGRAWGAYSRVVYLFTYMDNIIVSEGWSDWGISSRQQTVFYAQYKCFGPGANEVGRVRWSHELTDDEARPFLQLSFINAVEWLHEL